jgi:hypothetical protein
MVASTGGTEKQGKCIRLLADLYERGLIPDDGTRGALSFDNLTRRVVYIAAAKVAKDRGESAGLPWFNPYGDASMQKAIGYLEGVLAEQRRQDVATAPGGPTDMSAVDWRFRTMVSEQTRQSHLGK